MQESNPLVIYLDTSVVSAYFDGRAESRQEDTRQFWEFSRTCQFVVSRLVVNEIRRTPTVSRRDEMLQLVEGLSSLLTSKEAEALALDFIHEGLVPVNKVDDALHLALAVTAGVDFLVSWNFKHMVNYKTVKKLPVLAAKNGYFKQLIVISPAAFTDEMQGD